MYLSVSCKEQDLSRWYRLRDKGNYVSDSNFLTHLLDTEEKSCSEDVVTNGVDVNYGLDHSTPVEEIECRPLVKLEPEDYIGYSDAVVLLSIPAKDKEVNGIIDQAPSAEQQKWGLSSLTGNKLLKCKKKSGRRSRKSGTARLEAISANEDIDADFAPDLDENNDLEEDSEDNDRDYKPVKLKRGRKRKLVVAANKFRKTARKESMKENQKTPTRKYRTSKEPLSCDQCEKEFKSRLRFNKHMQVVHGKDFKCEVCMKDFKTNDTLRCHMALHKVDDPNHPFRCEFCGKTLTNKFKLIEHRRVHTKEKNFFCEVCKKSFASNKNLRIHLKVQHDKGDGKVYHCTYCTKKCADQNQLEAHISSMHTKRYKHTCAVCQKQFAVDHLFIRHMIVDHGQEHLFEKQFKCDQCDKEFVLKSELDKHKMREHLSKWIEANCSEDEDETSTEIKHLCKICNRTVLNRVDLRIHLADHKANEIFQCTICDSSFATVDLLRDHRLCSHNTEDRTVAVFCDNCGVQCGSALELAEHLCKVQNYNCTYCEGAFDNLFKMRIHMKDMHSGEESFFCLLCDKVYHTDTELLLHENALHQNYFKECEIVKKKSKILKQLMGEPEDIPPCPVCGKILKTKKQRDAHKFLHTDEKPFMCEICAKTFVTASGLKTHRNLHETSNVNHRFRCEYCGKTLGSGAHLAEHRRSHTKEKVVTCELCGKQLAAKKNLKIHIRLVHSGEQLVGCTMCDKKFARKDLLELHMNLHTNTNLFECHVCHKKFTVQVSLNHHMNIHTGGRNLPCSQCDRTFPLQCELQRHFKRVHLPPEEKKLGCDFCPKKFVMKNDLERHRRTAHLGIHPRNCHICGRGLTGKAKLVKHLARVHNIQYDESMKHMTLSNPEDTIVSLPMVNHQNHDEDAVNH